MTEQKTPLRYRWRDRVKSADGPDDPMLRLVLLVLGDWSPVDGGTFSVKNSQLAHQTGLTDRPIRDRLKQAEGVWFTRERQSRGRPYRYRLKIPTAIDAERPLEDVRGRSNGEWGADVENSDGCGASAPDPREEGAVPPRRTSGATAPDQCGASAPAIDVQIHTPDVARARSSSVENHERPALDSEAPESAVPQSSSKKRKSSEDDQLPLARLVLQAVQGGDENAFDEACAKIREERRKAARE